MIKETTLQEIFDKIDYGHVPQHEDLKYLLNLSDHADVDALHKKAYDIKLQHVGKTVYFRGIIEFSNICVKDCYYCGIRKSNTKTQRYQMTEDEIINAAVWTYQRHYGSIVLQSGERSDPHFIDFIERILKQIREKCGGALGVTLCLGEQAEGTYQRWFDAGAHRYLLRIETSNKQLYKKIHPHDHDFDRRKACLETLRRVGYQVGTGVMTGLPFQTTGDLVNDILFFKKNDIDMIGMGPYIAHDETPLAQHVSDVQVVSEEQLILGLNMIAVTRILLRDVNIAATTALQALHPIGREKGILAGANIIMPNVTDTKYRESYQLYQNKPCIDENATMCRSCLERRIYGIGEDIGFQQWGDSPHFFARKRSHRKDRYDSVRWNPPVSRCH